MHARVLLLRGVNVGGKHRLPMQALVKILQGSGLQDIHTVIQSGNAVFRSEYAGLPDYLADCIEQAIDRAHGFRPRALILEADTWRSAVRSNPFPQAKSQPKTLHLYFLAEAPAQPDMRGIEQIRAPEEQYVLSERVFYLYAPNGIGRSKLAARVDRLLGVPTTARNWRTVKKIDAVLLAVDA